MTGHLWDAHHEYYCETGNYYKNDECHIHYETWASFYAEQGTLDMDYNLVFRWDWDKPDEDEGVMGTLTVFWVGQRKAILRSTSVAVHPDEEPMVRAFLQPRLDHLLSLWAPLVPGAAEALLRLAEDEADAEAIDQAQADRDAGELPVPFEELTEELGLEPPVRAKGGE